MGLENKWGGVAAATFTVVGATVGCTPAQAEIAIPAPEIMVAQEANGEPRMMNFEDAKTFCRESSLPLFTPLQIREGVKNGLFDKIVGKNPADMSIAWINDADNSYNPIRIAQFQRITSSIIDVQFYTETQVFEPNQTAMALCIGVPNELNVGVTPIIANGQVFLAPEGYNNANTPLRSFAEEA